MQSEVSEISPVMVEVTIHVPWDQVKQNLEDTYQELGRTARVRGFRPGKVPRNVLQQVYGKRIDGEVTAQLVEAGLMHAVKEHELEIVAQPDVDAPSAIKKGEALTFKAKVEVRPKIEKVEMGKLAVERPSAEVTNEMVDEEVERLRKQHAEVQVPEPMRPSRAGDELTIDYTVDLDGEPKTELSAEGRRVELGADALIAEFDAGLTGLVPGDEKDISVTFGEDHDREDLRGKNAVFHVKVQELREKLLPEVDDEFAKDVGDYQTLLELRLKIRADLEEMAKRRAESELKDRLIDKLVEINDVPAPPSMVKQEEQRMLYEIVQLMQMTGGQGFGPDIMETMKGRAERKVKAAILLGALARAENIEVTREDVDARLAEIAEKSGKHVAKVRVEYQGERRDALESQILEEKLMDYLTKQATITDAKPEASEPAAKPEKTEKKTKKKKA
jgi:trigger factor